MTFHPSPTPEHPLNWKVVFHLRGENIIKWYKVIDEGRFDAQAESFAKKNRATAYTVVYDPREGSTNTLRFQLRHGTFWPVKG